MSEHTPGPWRTHLTDDTLVIDAVGVPVATMDGNYVDGSHANMEANARLIAAAPELLEALIIAMDWIDSWSPDFVDDEEWPSSRDKIRAAFSKATP